MEHIEEFKFFSHEEIVEALTLICNAKSTKIWIELHHLSEYTCNAKSIHFATDLKIIYVQFEHYPDKAWEESVQFDIDSVRGHEEEIAHMLEQMPFNYDLDDDFDFDDDEELREASKMCRISKADESEIIAEAYFNISPIIDDDIEMFSEQFHEQIPGKIKLKSLKCIPYPGEGSNSIALKRARNVTMYEILQMAKEILINAETEGRLSKCHCVEDLVVEEVTINLAAGHVLISLGS
jgi:hypothetical protein